MASNRLTYQGAKGCAKGPQPGTMVLYRHILDSPAWKPAKGQGVYNPRKVRGSNRTWSIHAEGRALDIGYPAGSATGDRLFDLLVAQCQALGIQQILWSGRGWRIGKGHFRLSTSSAKLHETHLHIEQAWHWALTLTPQQAATAFSAPIPEPLTILDQGDAGAAVKAMQTKLVAAGHLAPVTGTFDAATAQSLINFQRAHGLSVDAVYGPATAAKLTAAQPVETVEAFIDRIYMTHLKRRPSAADVGYWRSVTAEVGRDAVEQAVSQSDEALSVAKRAAPPVQEAVAAPPPAAAVTQSTAPTLSDAEVLDALAKALENRT